MLELIQESFNKIYIIHERVKNDVQSFSNFPEDIGYLIDEIFEFTFSIKFKSFYSYHIGYIYLSLCFQLLNLHNQNTISDDNFIRVVELYLSNERRSYQSIALFTIGVILQRIRLLQSPASRILMKSFELCSIYCKDFFNFLLVKIITQPSHIIESNLNNSNKIISDLQNFMNQFSINTYHFEFVQRILRQSFYTENYNIENFLSELVSEKSIIPLHSQFQSNSHHYQKYSIEYLLLDSFMNSSKITPETSSSENNNSFNLFSQYISSHNFNELQLHPFSIEIDQHSLKFLSAILTSVSLLLTSFYFYFYLIIYLFIN